MAKMSKQEIEKRLDSIQSKYAFRFAGHPRATRDLGELDKIIADTRLMEKKSKSLQRHTSGELRQRIGERLEHYLKERAAIVEVLTKGDEVRQVALLGGTANFIHANYRRHFAGQDRSTRDLGLMEEMHSGMQKVKTSMEELAKTIDDEGLLRDIGVVEGHLELYNSEMPAILEAQASGSANEQADRLAGLANNQFETYKVHFAGRRRLTRRPGLMKRLISNLTRIVGKMQKLSVEGDDKSHRNNIRIVSDRLEVYREELEAIEVSRNRANNADMIGGLGESANEEMATYRENFAGKDRATRDLNLLSQIADRLGEIERQMQELDLQTGDSTNARNMNLVRDNRRLYEREFDEITAAQAAAQN